MASRKGSRETSRRESREKRINKLVQKSLAYTATPWGSSKWKELRTCTMGHHLRYDLGIQQNGRADYFNIGGAIHSVLQFAGECALTDLKVEHDRWLDVLDEIDEQRLYGARTEVATNEAERLMRAYFAHWGAANAGYPPDLELDSTESLLKGHPGGEKHPAYTTRLDALLHRRKSLLRIATDHKTSSSMPNCLKDPNAPDYAEKLIEEYLTDPQFLGHSWLLREHYGGRKRTITTILVNLIIKTQRPEFRRVYFKPTHFQLNQWADQHTTLVRQLLKAEPAMTYGACVSPIGNLRCWAFKWCHGSETDRQEHFAIHHHRRSDAKEGEER